MTEKSRFPKIRRYKTRGAFHHHLTRANKALAVSLEQSDRGFLIAIARETASASIRVNPRITRANAAILYNRAFKTSLSRLMEPACVEAVEYENGLIQALS